jgi:hypothetical protein
MPNDRTLRGCCAVLCVYVFSLEANIFLASHTIRQGKKQLAKRKSNKTIFKVY